MKARHKLLRQEAANTGEEEFGTVRRVKDRSDYSFNTPAVNQLLRATLDHINGSEFVLTLENISSDNFSSPLTPGVFVIFNAGLPLFREGHCDYGQGLEQLAEDGNHSNIFGFVKERTGLTNTISPGVFAVHSNDEFSIVNESGYSNHGWKLWWKMVTRMLLLPIFGIILPA